MNKLKKFDLAFVLGSPSTKKQVEELKAVRKKSKLLVAYGACSMFGSTWGSKKWRNKEKIMKAVYDNPVGIDNLDYSGIMNNITLI